MGRSARGMGNQVDQQEGFLRSVIASGGISLFCCHNIVLGQYCIQYTTVRAVLITGSSIQTLTNIVASGRRAVQLAIKPVTGI